MKNLTINCPNCGATMKFESWQDHVVCEYCGSIVPISKETSIKASGAGNLNNSIGQLLQRAYILLEDGHFQEAFDYFTKVLEQSAHNSSAYLGLLMCSIGVRNETELVTVIPIFYNNENFVRAVQFADANEKKHLQELKQTNILNITHYIEERQKEIARRKQIIAEFNTVAKAASIHKLWHYAGWILAFVFVSRLGFWGFAAFILGGYIIETLTANEQVKRYHQMWKENKIPKVKDDGKSLNQTFIAKQKAVIDQLYAEIQATGLAL